MKLLYHPFHPFEAWNARGIPAISELHRAVESILAEAGDVDRRGRLLHWFRSDHRFGDMIGIAGGLHRIFGSQLNHRLKELIRTRATTFERSARGFKLIMRPADADAEQHAPTRQHIESGDTACKLNRCVVGQHHHASTQLDFSRMSRNERETLNRIED